MLKHEQKQGANRLVGSLNTGMHISSLFLEPFDKINTFPGFRQAVQPGVDIRNPALVFHTEIMVDRALVNGVHHLPDREMGFLIIFIERQELKMNIRRIGHTFAEQAHRLGLLYPGGVLAMRPQRKVWCVNAPSLQIGTYGIILRLEVPRKLQRQAGRVLTGTFMRNGHIVPLGKGE